MLQVGLCRSRTVEDHWVFRVSTDRATTRNGRGAALLSEHSECKGLVSPVIG